MRTAAKLKRNYVPGGPLFARRPIKLHGVTYRKGDALPLAELTKVRHHRLWISGLANHEPHGPFDKIKTAAPPAPASPPEVTVPAGAAALVEGGAVHVTPADTDTKLGAFKVAPGERVDVTTPSQGRSKPRR